MAELEQDELNKRLAGADSVPLYTPGGAAAGEFYILIRHILVILTQAKHIVRTPSQAIEEDEEEAELRELQAALAM